MPLTADRAKPAVPVRGHLPADRLRALQRRQQRLPPGRRADAVQVAQPRPPRHPDLADVDDARQLRHPGAGAAAGRQALVPRQRRRDLPVAQPDPRRAARHHRRGRCRPRLPHGLLPDGRPARRVRRRLHGRRDPAADRAGRPVRRDRRPARRPERIREFLEKPKDPVGLPDSPHEVLASMGNYVFDADALVEAVTRDADARAAPSTTWAATSCRRSYDAADAGVYDFKDNDVPGSTDRDRGYWRDVGTLRLLLRRAHGRRLAAADLQPLQLRVADLHRPTARSRRPSWSQGDGGAAAPRPTRRCSRRASWSPAARSTGRCCRPPCGSSRAPR